MKISTTATRPTLDDINAGRAKIAQQLRELKERAKGERFHESRATFAEIARLEKVSAFLMNNYKVICFESVAGSVARIFKKYDGKPYGTKTAQKIRSEVLADCGFAVYIDANRFTLRAVEIIDGFSGRGVSLDITTKRGATYFLTEDNKITAQPVENLFAYDLREYCDDIAEAIAKLEELKKQADELRAKYNEIADSFNALAVEGFEHLNHYYN